MIEKLEEIKHRFEEVGLLIVQPEIIQDIKKYMQLNKEYKDLEKIVTKYNQFRDALDNQQQAKEVL
jgi:peptide chain release factor 1